MTPGITKFMKNPGRAAAGGPVREHISTHDFVGGNAMLPGLLGSPEHDRLAKERLRSAATLEIENIENINETVKFNNKVTNVGAGHKIPTGLTEARIVWLADRILSDNRIPPKGHSIEFFTFNVPMDAAGPLSISAKLNYISATQELADELFGKGVIKPPVVEMASINNTIELASSDKVKKVPGFTYTILAMAILILYARIKRII